MNAFTYKVNVIKVENLSKKYILTHQQREQRTPPCVMSLAKSVNSCRQKECCHPFTVHPSPFTDSSQKNSGR